MYSVTDSYKRTGITLVIPNGIKDWNQVLSELFQSQVVDRDSVLFDPPGLYHVGQPECPEGNCYLHHIEMGETPCTLKIACDLREEFRGAQDEEARKIVRTEKNKSKFRSPLDEELQQQWRFERRRKQDDANPMEDFEPI